MKNTLAGIGCMLVVVILLALLERVAEFGCTAFKSYEVRTDHLFRTRSKEYINGLRSADPVTRANYACSLAEKHRTATLFVPYLIDLLSDNTPLQVASGPPVATKLLGSVVGDTTPSDRALYALEEITGKDFGKDAKRRQEWWDGWWAENRHRFKENPNR